MRRSVRIAALTASLATVLSGGLMATVASASAASASTGPSAHVINLHSADKAELARSVPLHKKIIMLPRGAHRAAKVGANGCIEPDSCNMTSGGGSVQHSPKVYLLLWGPNWGSGGTITDPAGQYLNSLYSGLGTSGDSWSAVNSQYTDSSGHPVFSGSVLAGVWQDTSTPPVQDQSTLAAEADAFASQQGITDTTNAQVVIASQSGTSFADGFGSQYCAWHSYSNEPYTNLPYLTDVGSTCGENFINAGSAGTYDGFSIVGGHEYAETITDPFPVSGWFDSNDPYGGEIGDKCAWAGLNWGGSDPAGNVSLSTGSFAMQSLYSNASSSCVMSIPATAFAHNPVSHLAATARYTNITATWDASANATSYKVITTLRGTTTRVDKSIVTTPYYHLGSLHRGTRYTVRVLARPAGPSAPYASVNITTRS
jgi:hypothetical protein